MNLFEQGFSCINDARFVCNVLLPVGMTHSRWNIVAYEAQRATALLLRGMICLLGAESEHHHDLHIHVSHLNRLVSDGGYIQLPFLVGAYMPNGHVYGIRIRDDYVSYVERNEDGVFTGMGNVFLTVPIADPTELTFELCESEECGFWDIALHHGERQFMRFSFYPSIPGQMIRVSKSFVRYSDAIRVDHLRQIGERLSHLRQVDLYSEERLSEADASAAIADMHQVFDGARIFLIVD